MLKIVLFSFLLMASNGLQLLRAHPHIRQRTVRMNSDEETAWGQSFIGQDVCGSKYNDEPFNDVSGKADAWEEFKKRCRALETKQAGNSNQTASSSKDITASLAPEPGKWP